MEKFIYCFQAEYKNVECIKSEIIKETPKSYSVRPDIDYRSRLFKGDSRISFSFEDAQQVFINNCLKKIIAYNKQIEYQQNLIKQAESVTVTQKEE